MNDDSRGANDARRLYTRWERQHWEAFDVDLSLDRTQWAALDDGERWQWFCLAAFSHFRASELHGAVSMSRYMNALPEPWQRIYLATQIADEARHAAFFERYYHEVLRPHLPAIPGGQELTPSPAYRRLFLEAPEALGQTLLLAGGSSGYLEAVLHTHVILEGSIAMASFILLQKVLAAAGRFPGLAAGLNLVQRDEVRHALFGLAVLKDALRRSPKRRAGLSSHVRKWLPDFDRVLVVHPDRTAAMHRLGLDPLERRRRSFALLGRHVATLGLDVAVIDHSSARAA